MPLTFQALSDECLHRVWSYVPVSPADLPGSLGLGESLRVSPSLSESHLGLEHPGRDFGPRASVRDCPDHINVILSDRTGPVTKTLFFSIISTEVSRQGRDGGTPGAPAARSGTTAAVARASQRV